MTTNDFTKACALAVPVAATSRAAGILAIVGGSDAAVAAVEQAAGCFRDQLIDALEVTVAK